MEDIHLNKIWLKLQSGRAACIIAVGLLFAMIGSANATTIITWKFDNTPQTVGPTDTIEMIATVTIEVIDFNTVSMTDFDIITIDPGTLIGQVDGVEVDPNNPYNIILNGGLFDGMIAYGGETTTFTFGVLEPIDGVAQFGTFTSGPDTTIAFNFDEVYTTQVTGQNTFTVNVVPEPSTMLLLASGLAGLVFFRRRK